VEKRGFISSGQISVTPLLPGVLLYGLLGEYASLHISLKIQGHYSESRRPGVKFSSIKFLHKNFDITCYG
jgi:hypothetical protein